MWVLRGRTYFWWFERVVCWKVYCEKKNSPLICTVRLGKKQNKRNALIYFSYFAASLLNTENFPRLGSVLENPLFPQYTAHHRLCIGKAEREVNPPSGLQSCSRDNCNNYCSSPTRLLRCCPSWAEQRKEQCLNRRCISSTTPEGIQNPEQVFWILSPCNTTAALILLHP